MPEKQDKGPVQAFIGFFASVKLSIALLLILAAASLLGTLLAQGESEGFYVHQYGEAGAKLLNALGMTNLYHSLWFIALIALLALNLVVCSLKRLPGTWKIVSMKRQSFVEGRFKSLAKSADFSAEIPLAGDMEKAREQVRAALTRRFRRVFISEAEKGFALYAESGRWTRLGPYVIHLGFVLVLVGGLWGLLQGYSGRMNLAEGDTSDLVSLKSGENEEEQTEKLPFSIRCDSFTVSYYDTGEVKEYLSRLTVIEDGQEAFSRDVLVNHPLRYRGVNVFQASYGVSDLAEVTLMFTESGGALGMPAKARIGERLPIPLGKGEFSVDSFESHFHVRGMELGPSLIMRLFPPGEEEETILIPMDYPGYDKMRRGDFVITVTDAQPRYYTGLSVTRDPGVPTVYAGFILLIAGCFITFFLSHRFVMGQATEKKKKSVLILRGSANRNGLGFSRRMEQVSRALGKDGTGKQ